MESIRHNPSVFVSSTCYDLKQVREDLKDFFEENYGFQTILSEFDSFPVDPCKGTFENCIENVDKTADIFVLIVGNRYGYVMENGKSITNLEYLHAKAKGISIYVFVNKQLYDNMKIWRSNKNANFSGVVDNTKIFEFVSGIYDESEQWIYTFDSVRDIKMALKNQLRLIFCDGLTLQKVVGDSYNRIINKDIPSNAVRVFVEKPYAWEYKFLACVLKGEFDKLQSQRWDFKYSIYPSHIAHMEPPELLDDISQKFKEMIGLTNILSTLLNSALQDAIGDPEIPSDLDMMIYVSRQIAAIYKRMIEWGLYFKAIHTDEAFEKLLQLLYELPGFVMKQIDEFIEDIYEEITAIPDIEDGIERNIHLTCTLNNANIEQINEEMQHLSNVFNHVCCT